MPEAAIATPAAPAPALSARKRGTRKITVLATDEGGLRNGSLYKRSRYGLSCYMNGDYMGFIEESDLPEGLTEYPLKEARAHAPACCF